MSDKPPALAGALDTMRPRTIKAISDRAWEIITSAARAEDVTVGTWLEKRVLEWQADGSPMPVERPETTGAYSDKPNLQDVARLLDAAVNAAEKAGVPVPGTMAREAMALVRQTTRAARGLPPMMPRRKALPSPE